LNAAILSSMSLPSEPKLPSLVKLLDWTQSQLGEKVQFPRINNILTGELEIGLAGGDNNIPHNSTS
ncbi:hypothetical protein IWQ61_010774, partial [Dispira simplex]